MNNTSSKIGMHWPRAAQPFRYFRSSVSSKLFLWITFRIRIYPIISNLFVPVRIMKCPTF